MKVWSIFAGLMTGTAIITLLTVSCQDKKAGPPPNIILIAVDDMGYSDLGCYGSEISTPNIDRLAAGGLRFRSFYNTSKCFPSRAALITGVYAQDCGYHETFRNPIEHAVTIGEVLKNRGYQTLWVGKHHSTELPTARGFDSYYGLLDGAANHFNPGKQRTGEAQPAQKRGRTWVVDNEKYEPYAYEFPSDFYTSDTFTDYALKYLEKATDNSDPFFLYLAYTAPHDPLMAWPEDIARYSGVYDEGYEALRKRRFERQQALGLLDERYQLSDPMYEQWEDLSSAEQKAEARKMEVYAAMIDRMDQNVGRLLDRLKQLSYDENTVIFFVSDNGASREVVNLTDDDDEAPIGSLSRWVSLGQNWANVSNTPFRFFKNDSYEGGINTPMIAYWPGRIAADTYSDFPGHIVDFMATVVDISGATYPTEYNGQEITPMRGESLLPAFDQQRISRKSPLFWEWNGGQAMRHQGWKIVRDQPEHPWDLYHISTDPTELNDRADQNPQLVQEMDSTYQSWYRQYY